MLLSGAKPHQRDPSAVDAAASIQWHVKSIDAKLNVDPLADGAPQHVRSGPACCTDKASCVQMLAYHLCELYQRACPSFEPSRWNKIVPAPAYWAPLVMWGFAQPVFELAFRGDRQKAVRTP
eukprot:4420190-Alexandrium_andersonii.AAC.1